MREWYDDIEGDCWADAQCHTIRNWPSMFRRWLKNRARFAALRAVPEQPRRVRTPAVPRRGPTTTSAPPRRQSASSAKASSGPTKDYYAMNSHQSQFPIPVQPSPVGPEVAKPAAAVAEAILPAIGVDYPDLIPDPTEPNVRRAMRYLEANGFRRRIAGDGDFRKAAYTYAKLALTARKGLIVTGETGVGKTHYVDTITRRTHSASPRIWISLGVTGWEEGCSPAWWRAT